MSYRVVVDVPETAAKNEKEAVHLVKLALIGSPAYRYAMVHANWDQRVKSYIRTRGAERAQAEKNPLAMDLQDVAEKLINISNRISDGEFELSESPMRAQLKKEEQAQETAEPQFDRREGRIWRGLTSRPTRRKEDPI